MLQSEANNNAKNNGAVLVHEKHFYDEVDHLCF